MDRVVRDGLRRTVLILLFGISAFVTRPASALSSVTLLWNPSPDPDVVGYNIYYGVQSGVYTNKIDAGNATGITISGLVEGTTYYFAATAYNILGMESEYSNETTYTVPIVVVNQRPTLDPIANVTINEDAGLQTVNLTGITAGSNEVQTLTVTATSSNPSLIPNPTVNYTSPNTTGSLTFTPVANLSGTATITVIVDDGQTNSSSVIQSFNVTVNPVNDRPTLGSIGDLSINEDASQQTVNLSGIGSGAANESQTLAVTASSSNPSLIPNPTVTYTSPNSTGSLAFTPAANANGSATITVTVNDGQAQNNTTNRTFVVTVNAVNDRPAIGTVANVTINEDSGQQTVNLTGINSGAGNENQTLTVTASSSSTGLIPNPTVTYGSPSTTGSLTFTPVANMSGSATITVTVDDGQALNNATNRTFTVTVNPVNDPPTLAAIGNIVVSQNSGLQSVSLAGISAGSGEAQTLTVTATSSAPSVIPNPAVSYTSPNATGSLSFTPAAGASGLVTITVTVNDGQATANTVSRTFTVLVNTPPAIGPIANRTISTNSSTGPIAFTVGDGQTVASALTLQAASSNPLLIPTGNILFGGSASNRTVTLTPLSDQSGTADITITVSDGDATTNRTFLLTVLGQPLPPSGLTIVTMGEGSVTPDLSGQALVAGQTYSITAVPGVDQIFDGWSGDVTSSNAQLTFVMSPGMVLQAKFKPNPFVAGTYNGLFYEESEIVPESSGAMTVSVTSKGAYSAKLQLGTSRYAMKGQLASDACITNVILRKVGGPLTVKLRVGNGSEKDLLFGSVADTNWESPLLGDRAVFDKLHPAPTLGTYTIVLPGTAGSGTKPGGHSYGVAKVASTGAVKLAGTMADKTKISQGAVLSKNGVWPLYIPAYKGKGVVISWLSISNETDSDIKGLLSWIKPPDPLTLVYPAGFTNECDAVGSVYTAPLGTNALKSPSALFKFRGGNLSTAFTNCVIINGGNKMVTNLSSNPIQFKLSSTTGTFSGSVVGPNGEKKVYLFNGIILQKQNTGYGFLESGSKASETLLTVP